MLGVFIVHPGQHNYPTWPVITEEQSVLLKELGGKPVLIILAQRAVLAVLGPGWILRDDVICQLGDHDQSFSRVLLDVTHRIFLLQRLDLLDERLDLIQEKGVIKNRPAVYKRWGGIALAHSSSADSGASRSASTLPTSDWMRATRLARRSGWLAMSRVRKPRNWPSTGSSSDASAQVSTTSPLRRIL